MWGEIENASGSGTVGNAKCGDIMKMDLKVENGIIIDAKFKTFGCCAAVATSSMATEMVIGKTIEEALALTNKEVMDELGGLPPVKVHCSVSGGRIHSRGAGRLPEKARPIKRRVHRPGFPKGRIMPEIHGNLEGIKNATLTEIKALYEEPISSGFLCPL